MTQLIVSLEDNSMLSEIKRAILMLRGVTSVRDTQPTEIVNPNTLKALNELENGETVVCEDFNEYLKLVNRELPD